MVNVKFINNTAPYGPNVASYPVKLVVAGSNSSTIILDNVASGQVLSEEIKLYLVDEDNQVISDGTPGSVIISAVDSNTKALGRTSEGIVLGVATFKGLIFIGKPGTRNAKFTVSTNAINRSKIMKQFGKYES